MKKYILIAGVSLFFFACGNQGTNEETEELTPEQETVFVEEESRAIDSSLTEVTTEVEESERKVDELLEGI
jgi:hypothetical protein